MDGKEIIAQWESEDYRCNIIVLNSQSLIAAIDTAIAQARAEEREACAMIAEDFEGVSGQGCADAIRARTP